MTDPYRWGPDLGDDPDGDLDGYDGAVTPIDLTGADRAADHDPYAEDETPRQRYTVDLGLQPTSKLINYNRMPPPKALWARRAWWQRITRQSYDVGAQLDRAQVTITIWLRTESDAARDISNLHYTTKGIVDGLATCKDEYKDGKLVRAAQLGWIIDDNDRVIIGPDLRRGLDPTLRRGLCRVTIELTELGPHEQSWWELGDTYEQLQLRT